MTVNLDVLLARLREVAATMPDADPVPAVAAQPFVPMPLAKSALPWDPAALLCNTGWLTLLAVDEHIFVELMYRRWLGRRADAQGLQFWLEQLGLRKPRLEVMALFLNGAAAEAGAVLAGWRQWPVKALVRLLQPRHPRFARLMRAALRRLEWRLQARARAGVGGFCYRLTGAVGTALEAQLKHLAAVERQVLGLHGAHADIQQQLGVLSAARNEAEPADVQAFLAALETHFRQGDAFLREQLKADYLPRVLALKADVGDAWCLDVGCGHGVWLGLLRDNGLDGAGADVNPAVAQQARDLGLDVVCQDGVSFLQQQPDASAMLVTGFHVMEHVPLATRLALLKECARVLKPGGVLILETPNPENVWVGTHTFYHDPTHTQPLTPDGLAFLVGYHGLEVTDVLRLHPYPAEAKVPEVDDTARRLNGMTCGGQDFAVLARKRA